MSHHPKRPPVLLTPQTSGTQPSMVLILYCSQLSVENFGRPTVAHPLGTVRQFPWEINNPGSIRKCVLARHLLSLMSSALLLSPQPHQAAGAPVFLWSMKASLQGQMCVLLCSKHTHTYTVHVYLGQRSEESTSQKGENANKNWESPFFNLLALRPHDSCTLRVILVQVMPPGCWLKDRVALRY